MKVISGKYKGILIDGFDIDGTRPTMDRLKESLFAMIQEYLKDANVLDLFAGSGNLGIESISNYASKVTFVDCNKKAIQVINHNLKKINIKEKFKVILSDCFSFLNNTNEKYDIIFLDPPYKTDYIEKVIPIILEKKILQKDGIIVCEYENKKFNFDSLEIWKERKYGSKIVTIYKEK